ncbi:MAG: two pore domain potassium channel family protein [Olsenella sp.]|nr:two pore domain potassium channel family protein [Olsenella sp.]
MRHLHLMSVVLRRSGVYSALGGFLVLFLVCAAAVTAFEPSVGAYGDALWYCWEVATTVGLGDIAAVTVVGRVVSVALSLYAIVVTAIVTSVLVDYFQERRQAQLDQSLSEFLDKLERLPELDKSELEHISKTVRKFRK